jgi:large subunit ribosomal protein L3
MKDNRIVLGKKVGMTQIFDANRCLIPVTVIKSVPCVVSQLKSVEGEDGYNAVQLAYGERKLKNVSDPVLGHIKKANLKTCEGLKEFRTEDVSNYQVGNSLDFSIFQVGELIDVIGRTKGHGFQGVVKRYRFGGGPASHGSMFHRRGGSYGCRQWPGHVYKGRKMPGHDGCAMRTVKNLEVVDLMVDKGLLLLRGSLPGAKNGLIVLRKAKKAKKGAWKMKLKMHNQDGTFLGDREYNIPVFEEDRGVAAVKFTIDALRANMRQGNASTKTRSDVRGGGKKPFRQKGTGRARQGSNRSPLMPGGGVTFGPHPRDYSKKVNKKVKKLALARSLYDCAEELLVSVIDSFSINFQKTKEFSVFVEKIFPSGTVLMIDECFDDALMLVARNVERIFTINAASVNALDLKSYDRFLVSEAGFTQLLERVR